MMFPVRLKLLREENGLSQAMLAKAIGIAQSTIGGWEASNREPNIDMLVKISDYFGVTIDYLVGRSDAPDAVKIKKPASLADFGVEKVVKSGSDSLTPEEIEALRAMLNNHLDQLRKEDSRK